MQGEARCGQASIFWLQAGKAEVHDLDVSIVRLILVQQVL